MPPLFLDGWLEFNRIKWNVTPQRARFAADGAELPAVEMVYYLNDAGHIWRPPANPYNPVRFESTPTQSAAKRDRQWLTVGTLLAEDIREHGLCGSLFLPLEINDVRPWQWTGFAVTVRYTYCVDLPHEQALLDSSIRRQISRSAKGGFHCEPASNLAEIFDCMRETEQRQDFSFGLTLDDLELAKSLLGVDAFRGYICRAPSGEAAVGSIVLHQRGYRALAWVIGTKNDYMRAGATQLLTTYILDDLHASGASGFDFVGANFPTIASAKSFWGGYLAMSYTIEAPSVKGIARDARDYVRFRRWRPS